MIKIPQSSVRNSEHQQLYALKEQSYFSGARLDYIEKMPDSEAARILEIGCGNGATGAEAIARNKCGKYIGVEVFEPIAAQAAKVLNDVHVGNIEIMDLPYPEKYFDILILSEVLEHLVKPNDVIARISKLLKPGALVFASSPNIAHWRVIFELVKGRFEYQGQGIMDESHVHWFTPFSFEALFNRNGIATKSLGNVGNDSRGFRVAPIRLQHLFMAQINFVGFKS